MRVRVRVGLGLGSGVLALLLAGLRMRMLVGLSFHFGRLGLVVRLGAGGLWVVLHLGGWEGGCGGASFLFFELVDAGFGFIELLFHAF